MTAARRRPDGGTGAGAEQPAADRALRRIVGIGAAGERQLPARRPQWLMQSIVFSP